MPPPEWRPVVLAAVAALLVGIVAGSCWPRPDPGPLRDWRREAEQVLTESRRKDTLIRRWVATAEAHEAQADSARRQAEGARRQAAAATGQVAALRAQLAVTPDSVPVLVALVAQQDTVIAQQDTVIAHLETANGALVAANTLLHVAVDTLTNDLTAIRASLRRGLDVTPKPCKVLFVPCPSRTTTFVVGAVLGAVGTVALTR